MSLSAHPIPAFTDNYIWTLVNADSSQACVVDPGDAAPVIAYLESNSLQLSHILITHHHPDHTGGLQALAGKYQAKVFGPDNPGIKGITDHLREGDRISVWQHEFQVLEVPGHTLDHIAYVNLTTSPPVLFCGDTLFAAGCGRLFEGTPEQMFRSLEKLRKLPADTRVYCTHEYTMANLKFAAAAEPDNDELKQRIAREQAKRDKGQVTLPSSIALELETNPFLRCQSNSIKKQLQQNQLQAEDPVSVFAALRSWKDNF